MVLDARISKADIELLQASADMRMFTMERKAEVEASISDTARVVLDGKAVSIATNSECEAEVENRGAQVSSGSFWIKGLRLGTGR